MSEFRRKLMKGKQYTIVDHVLTNGKVYIDTGYFPNPDTEVELSCNMGNSVYSNGTRLWCVTEAPYIYAINHGGNGTGVLYCWPYKIYGEQGANINIIETIEKTDIVIAYKYINEEYRAYVNEQYVKIDTPVHCFSKPLFLLYSDETNTIYNVRHLKIYSFKILERGKLIKHFVPALKDGIYGMADIIEGKYYASPNGESFNY